MLEIIIGQVQPRKIPYPTKNIQAIKLIIRTTFMFLGIKDTTSKLIAMYPKTFSKTELSMLNFLKLVGKDTDILVKCNS